MNFQFPKLYLTEPSPLQATNLLQLVSGDRSTNQSQNLDIPLEYLNSAKPRSIDEIIMDIENQSIDSITPLEWIYCLSAKETWDEQQPTNRTRSTSRAIWRIARQQSHDWLKYRLFYRLAYFYNENPSTFTLPRSLAETFSSFEPTNGDDVLVVKLLQSLQSSQPDRQLAELSFNNLQTPQTLFMTNRLPYQLPVVKRALNHVIFPLVNTRSLDSDRVSWFLNCLKEMDREQELQAVENLLNSQMSDRPIEEIANWLKNNYGIGVINSRWHELSAEAQIKINKWIGLINYKNFEIFVNSLIQFIDLDDKSQRQLKKRKIFWSHYSEKFFRLKILLPTSSMRALNINRSNLDIDQLLEDGSDLSEVCIFDFGERIIVELFRGRASETRLLEKTEDLENYLFNNRSNLSIKILRSLGGERHDHVHCWQSDCERWLAQHKILPNEGITRFRGVPNECSRYTPDQGLPKPSNQDMRDREEQKQRWSKDINSLEQEAKNFVARLKPEI